MPQHFGRGLSPRAATLTTHQRFFSAIFAEPAGCGFFVASFPRTHSLRLIVSIFQQVNKS